MNKFFKRIKIVIVYFRNINIIIAVLIGGGRGGFGGGGRGGGASFGGGNEYGAEHTDYVTIPATKCGLVIGKGGETIKNINSSTGAHCEVDKSAPPDAR